MVRLGRRRTAAGSFLVTTAALVLCVASGGASVRGTPGAVSTRASTPNPGFGVLVNGSGDYSGIVEDLGARWARVNVNLGRRLLDVRPYLARGINVILTVSNKDASNADPTYGTSAQWPQAGFPFLSADRYSAELRGVLAPLVGFLSSGRQVWVQCENEVSDASRDPNSGFWRGTTTQYLTLEKTCHDTTKSTDRRMSVVLSSFSSLGLEQAVSGTVAGAGYHRWLYEKLLSDASYDAVDLHFYGCVSDIASKVHWVDGYRPSTTRWISTENGGPDPRCPSTPQSWQQDHTGFEQAQAAQVPERLEACGHNGGAVCLWFSLFDLPNGGVVFGHLGLIDGSTSPPRKKPAYGAFRAFTAPAITQRSARGHTFKLTAPGACLAAGGNLTTSTAATGSSNHYRVVRYSYFVDRGIAHHKHKTVHGKRKTVTVYVANLVTSHAGKHALSLEHVHPGSHELRVKILLRSTAKPKHGHTQATKTERLSVHFRAC